MKFKQTKGRAKTEKAVVRLKNKKNDASRKQRAEELSQMRSDKKAYGGKIKVEKPVDTRNIVTKAKDSFVQGISLGTVKPNLDLKRKFSYDKGKPETIMQGVKHKVIDKIGSKNYNRLNDNKGKIATGLGMGAAGAAYAHKKKKEDDKNVVKRTVKKFIDDYI